MLMYADSAALLAILIVADLFEPLNNLAVELFLNGDVRQGSGSR